MILLHSTSELHSQNHTLALYCVSCDRWGEANLDWLIQNGKGSKLVTDARFRCRKCGEIVEKQVRAAGAGDWWVGGVFTALLDQTFFVLPDY